MLEGVADLTLDQLNEATLAWVELEYNRKVHSEIGADALAALTSTTRMSAGPVRPPSNCSLAFTAEVRRTQRRSDGTLSSGGHSLRGALPLRAPARTDRALCLLGLEHGPSGRSHNRRHSLPALSPGQKQKCRRPARAPTPAPCCAASAPAPAGHGPLAPEDHPAIRHHRACPRPTCPSPKPAKPRMNKKLLTLYGLKFNPFSSQSPRHAPSGPPRRSKASAGASNSRSAKAASPWPPAIRARARAPPCASWPSAWAPCAICPSAS